MLSYFSCSSSINISFTQKANTFEIFYAITVQGVYLSVSIKCKVCLETFTLLAKSCFLLYHPKHLNILNKPIQNTNWFLNL